MNKIRLALIDDHAVLRAGLRMLLDSQTDMHVVGDAADGEEALRVCRELHPDVVLMDISMPGLGGIEATKILKRECPQIKVLVLTMHEDEAYFNQVLRAGGSGYVLKRAADTELLSAIRAVHRGDVFLHPSVAKVLVEQMLQTQGPVQPRGTRETASGLSEREKEVLRLIALGHTNQEIADVLYLSVKTVETHKARIMIKLGTRTRSELVRYAMQHNLI